MPRSPEPIRRRGRHHLAAHGPGISLPGGHHELARPVRGGLAIIQHPPVGGRLRSWTSASMRCGMRWVREGRRCLTPTRACPNEGWGQPVHQQGVHLDAAGTPGQHQHGWKRDLRLQHLGRAVVAHGEVRGDVTENQRQRHGGPQGTGRLLPVLQQSEAPSGPGCKRRS